MAHGYPAIRAFIFTVALKDKRVPRPLWSGGVRGLGLSEEVVPNSHFRVHVGNLANNIFLSQFLILKPFMIVE